MFNLCHFGGYFNPRPPWGGRPIRPTPQDHMPCYFNPRPPWGGRPCFRSRSRGLMYISIHALRGEGDKKLLKFLQVLLLFQSTPSVGRATALFNHLPKTRTNFNPRPPWGGRQYLARPYERRVCYFNPRPPWGGRQSLMQKGYKKKEISIHALRGEGDLAKLKRNKILMISIHALRGEGDRMIWQSRAKPLYFNPRPPWGGRLKRFAVASSSPGFQSTPSVGRAT